MIVKVKYWSEELNAFNSREYSYLSEDELKIGDLVIMPVRDTTGKAMVTAVDLPESSIAAFKDKIKTIPAGSLVKEKTLPVEPINVRPLSDEARAIITAGRDEMMDAATTDKMSQIVPE